jgi:hypothetical protein
VPPTPTVTPGSGTQVVLFPNPVTGSGPIQVQITDLTAGSDISIEVYTTAFRKVLKETFPNEGPGTVTLSIPSTGQNGTPLANGVYYVVVRIHNQHFTLKLMVLR